MTPGHSDWRVTVIVELDHPISDAVVARLDREAEGRTILTVNRRRPPHPPELSASATECAVEPVDAVQAAVRDLQFRLGGVEGAARVVRVRNYLTAGSRRVLVHA